MSDVPEQQSFMQRLRSGGLGNAIRTRRGPVRKPAPAPPTAPLPAIPTMPVLEIPQVKLQRPVARRILTDSFTNTCEPSPFHSPSTTFLTADFASKLAFALNTPPGSAVPSPIDPLMARSYFDGAMEALDEEMKEN